MYAIKTLFFKSFFIVLSHLPLFWGCPFIHWHFHFDLVDLQFCNDILFPLCQGLNLSLNTSKNPMLVLHITCSKQSRVCKDLSPSWPSQFSIIWTLLLSCVFSYKSWKGSLSLSQSFTAPDICKPPFHQTWVVLVLGHLVQALCVLVRYFWSGYLLPFTAIIAALAALVTVCIITCVIFLFSFNFFPCISWNTLLCICLFSMT